MVTVSLFDLIFSSASPLVSFLFGFLVSQTYCPSRASESRPDPEGDQRKEKGCMKFQLSRLDSEGTFVWW
jgi:hypothetical protein